MTSDQTIQAAAVHFRAGRLSPAADLCRQAIDRAPDHAGAHNLLGSILAKQNDLPAAITAYRRAVELQPDLADAHYNLGVAYQKTDRLHMAIACWRQAIAARPDYVEALVSLGVALVNVGQVHESIASFERALTIQPDARGARFCRSLSRLLLGDFLGAWPDYEWRHLDKKISPRLGAPAPRWDGSNLAGRRILLHAEQGHGDTIQFARYVPMVAARGGTVLLEVQPALARLFKNFPGVTELVTAGQPLPEFDLHCPLMSLPGIFGTTVQSIPAQKAYLHPDPTLVKKWRDRLAAIGGLKVGLAWSGSLGNNRNRARSIPAEFLLPLANIPNVRLVSLQKWIANDKTKVPGSLTALHAPPSALNLLDFTNELSDFSETAALIQNLDLVISVDTAVAHLTGALGKPLWVMLAFVPDWRWLLDRRDSPWYPRARLFRPPALDDWSTPVLQAAAALRELAGGA